MAEIQPPPSPCLSDDRQSDALLEVTEAGSSSAENSSQPSDASIWRLSAAVTLLALALIGAMLAVSLLYARAAGWVAVTGAALIFGSTGVPMKISSFAHADTRVDSVVFACYSNLGVLLVSLPVLLYLLAREQFVFYPYAILGAANIMVVSYFAFNAVRELGYAIAPAIWAGIGMTCAFVWGAVAFNEEIGNLAGAVLAVLCLVSGVAAISLSRQLDSCAKPLSSLFHQTPSVGLVHCLLTGFFDGSLMVAFKLSRASSLTDVLSYIASFGIGICVASPVLFCLYCAVVLRGVLPNPHLATALLPGVMSGVLWAAANFMSVHATHYLVCTSPHPCVLRCALIHAGH